jgi:hypothetical protein
MRASGSFGGVLHQDGGVTPAEGHRAAPKGLRLEITPLSSSLLGPHLRHHGLDSRLPNVWAGSLDDLATCYLGHPLTRNDPQQITRQV